MYEADRIRFRRVDPVKDLDDRYRWMNDPETVRHLGMRPAMLSREEIRRFLETVAAGMPDAVEFAVETGEGRHIGGCSLRGFNQVARSAEFAIVIGEPQFRGKGYGTEITRLAVRVGFEQFNFNRIWLHVSEENPAGIRAYEKAGFDKEGLLRQHGFTHGRYYNAYIMAILRNEPSVPRGPFSPCPEGSLLVLRDEYERAKGGRV
jgi:[ribosomal protein S5]-alanine N-acetyltransferase